MLIPFFAVFIFGLSPVCAFAQSPLRITGALQDVRSQEPISFATVSLSTGERSYRIMSGEDGQFHFAAVAADDYTLEVKALGYEPYTQSVSVNEDRFIRVSLVSSQRVIDEVYVTAAEAREMTSTSVIDRKAMELLQPSSFADLLELLPGGRAIDPNLTEMNNIRLREPGILNNAYDISSLGTAFYIDGAPINTNANLQNTDDIIGDENRSDPNFYRNSVNRGVDMRFISTDDIEQVKVVRGIPSVEYGDLTSGLIQIERRKGATPFNARIKADGFSKLASIGKGFSLTKQNLVINLDGGFLDAKDDPRNDFENYQRVNGSLRTNKNWDNARRRLAWTAALDYQTNIDREKVDPDNGYAPIDRYSSTFNSYGLNNQVLLAWREHPLLESLELTSKVSYQRDRIDQVKWIQAPSATILANALVEGAHDASYITPSYASHLIVDGQPLTAFLKARLQLSAVSGPLQHDLKLGVEGNYSKNFGEGLVYNLDLPPNQSGSTGRPRAFHSIPATQVVSFFAEDLINFAVGTHRFTLMTGLRGMSMINMDRRYALAGKLLADPRINAKWSLPAVDVAGHSLWVALGGGYGTHTKTPTMDQLYPAPDYQDLIQLNFYHNNPDYRKANVMTYIIDRVNPELGAAVNHKWELSTDLQYEGNRLSVTYFRERMHTGFRDVSQYTALAYRQYDGTSIDAGALTAPPQLGDFTYEEVTEYWGYTQHSNGSSILKKGMEFQFTSTRMAWLNARVTLNGAWFHTVYRNSEPYSKVIPTTAITADDQVRQYVGIYAGNRESYDREVFNTNLTADGYLPGIGLNAYVSLQSTLFRAEQTVPRSGVPVQYIDIEGAMHPFIPADQEDADLQWLVEPTNPTEFRRYVEPFKMQINVKASKSFRDQIRVSMFVNRLFTYAPDYEEYGILHVRRDTNGPYFGMEINFSF
ncbi:TonB-dependent receptor [Parapedobacter sp. DT-150]|uniref:TonB-dependent receptor n=1 Tax=Parapedobacter sp. DT-150 TaxID=3396162 RepID=UPI003F1DD3FA